MRRICLFLGVIFISILSQTIVLGSQSMQGIAINEETSECIGYNP